MARIEPNFINQLLARINIVDLIQGRVALKKAGKDYQACCPFHKEKTPSFTVSEEKQFYHCFGCGEHGTALGFLMKYDGLTFHEGVELLAQRAGMEMPQNSYSSKPQLAVDPYELLEQCCQLFSKQLQSHQPIQQYLKQRQLDRNIIQQFRLGYAADSWDNLLRYFSSDSKKLEVLNKLDMLVDRRNEDPSKKIYDRFRNRLIFPIIDRRGRAIAFGARVINPDDQPKYLNNSETLIFQKRREIYGLYQCLQAEKSPPYLIVTEGYMDVIALHQAGIPRAIASMGTALTVEQITLLFRYTKRLIVCFDGDSAGQKATERGLKTILPNIKEDWMLEFLLLPEGVDPDSYIKEQGRDVFLNQLEHSLGVLEFIKVCLQQHGDTDNPEHKPRLAQEAKKWIAITAHNAWRHSLISSLSQYLEIDSQYLIDNSSIPTHKGNKQPTYWTAKNSRYAPQLKQADRILIYALSCPDVIQELDEVEINILSRISPLINQLIQVIYSSDLQQMPMGVLIENWHGMNDYEILKKYLVWRTPLNREEIQQEIKKIIHTLQQQRNKDEWQELQQKMKLYGEGGLSEDEKKRYLQLIYQRQTSAKK